MGPDWTFVSSHWCAVGRRNDKYISLDTIKRTLVGLRIEASSPSSLRVSAQRRAGLGGLHAPDRGRLDAYLWRRKQVLEIAKLFKPEETPWVMVGASLSSTRTPPHKGVRLWLQNRGLTHLRGKLRSSELIGEGNNTSKGKTNALAKGRWFDDILTGTAIELYYGRLELTPKVTDNNALKAWAPCERGTRTPDGTA